MDLWAVGVYDFHLAEATFWDLTIEEYGVLMKRHEAAQHREDLRAAMVAAAVYNVNRPSSARPITPEQLLGQPRTVEQRPGVDLLAKAREITAMFGGKV